MANFPSTYFGNSGLYQGIPSPSLATYFVGGDLYGAIPSPALATYFAPSSVTVSANFRYYQRVYSSGLGTWCYYSTVNAPNSNPDPSATSPNWTGTISDAQVVATALIAQ